MQPSPAASPAAPAPALVAGPPPTFPPPTTSHNPFKNAGSFSHKSRTTSAAGTVAMGASGTALASPAVVGLAAASRAPLGFEANLETTPDNSERPDRPLASPYRGVPAPPAPLAPPDNLEVAPRSDRNEYMQTAHLSSGAGDYGENAEYAPPPPPPGLRRLVVGVGEEPPAPPPGLARMVPGRQTEPGERRYRQVSSSEIHYIILKLTKETLIYIPL